MENPSVKATFDGPPALTIPTTSSDSSSSPSPQSLCPTAAAPTTTFPLPQPPPPPPVVSPVVLSPCAACKILRRRCIDKCVLAPYFPPTEPYKFTIAHRIFGASNIIKFLQELPESQRADAVSSMVYEANARLRDPVYGCAGAICHLQKQVSDLQAQLAKSQAELLNLQAQHTNLVALIFMEMSHNNNNTSITYDQEELMNVNQFPESSSLMVDDASSYAWESSSVWA